MFQRVLDAIGTIAVEALATTGPNLDVADLRAPKNVHVLRGAPHDLVMKDVSLVVSQGGHGTVTRSLVNALPQLILPMARDQAANAARVEAKGAGLRLPPVASEVEMAAAMNRLLTEPQFEEAARCVGDASKAHIDRRSLAGESETTRPAGRPATGVWPGMGSLRPQAERGVWLRACHHCELGLHFCSFTAAAAVFSRAAGGGGLGARNGRRYYRQRPLRRRGRTRKDVQCGLCHQYRADDCANRWRGAPRRWRLAGHLPRADRWWIGAARRDGRLHREREG